LVENLLVHGPVEYRHHHLDPTIEVPPHDICRGNIDFCPRGGHRLAIAEAIDTAVFQEAPDYGFHPDIVRETRYAGSEAADAAHDEIDFHTGLAGIVKRIDHKGIDQRIHLEHDRGRLSRARQLDFMVDIIEQGLAQIDRRDGDGLEFGRAGIAGDEIEHPRYVPRDYRIDGEIAQIGINLGGDGMIIARADMAVADQLAFFAPHHLTHLGVGLELDKTKNDLCPCPLQIARPADIRL